MVDPTLLNLAHGFKSLAKGTRDDFHEPSKQDIRLSSMEDGVLDNAFGNVKLRGEALIVLTRNGNDHVWNLANLLALAKHGANALIDRDRRGRSLAHGRTLVDVQEDYEGAAWCHVRINLPGYGEGHEGFVLMDVERLKQDLGDEWWSLAGAQLFRPEMANRLKRCLEVADPPRLPNPEPISGKHFECRTYDTWRRCHPTNDDHTPITDSPRPHIVPVTARARSLVALHALEIVNREYTFDFGEKQEVCNLCPGMFLDEDGVWRLGYRFIAMEDDAVCALLDQLDQIIDGTPGATDIELEEG